MDQKQCGRCGEDKDIDQFALHRVKDRQSYCRSCGSEYKREWIKEHRNNVRWNTLWTKYRLRQEEYEAMYEEQDGRCAICRVEKKILQVDHCHATKVVRGLLCSKCNIAIGWFEVNLNRLDALRKYLAPSSNG